MAAVRQQAARQHHLVQVLVGRAQRLHCLGNRGCIVLRCGLRLQRALQRRRRPWLQRQGRQQALALSRTLADALSAAPSVAGIRAALGAALARAEIDWDYALALDPATLEEIGEDRMVVIVVDLAGGDQAVCFSVRPDDMPKATLDVLNASINSLTAK